MDHLPQRLEQRHCARDKPVSWRGPVSLALVLGGGALILASNLGSPHPVIWMLLGLVGTLGLSGAVLEGAVPRVGEDPQARETRLRELAASEEKFATAFRLAAHGMGIAELETGRFIEVNDGFCSIYGFSRSEAIGRTAMELGLWSSREIRTQFIQQLMAQGTVRDLEFPKHNKEGHVRQILLSAALAEIGGKRCIVSVIQDITERKRAEELEKGQRQVLEMIAADAPLQEILETLIRVVEASSQEMLCSILLLDTNGRQLRCGAAPSLPAAYNKAIDGITIGPCGGSCGTAAYLNQAVYVEDIASDPLWADYKDAALPHGLRACWSTPIGDAEKKVLGTFAIYYRQPGLPTERHHALIAAATDTAAIAIGRQRAKADLQESEEKFLRAQRMEAIGQLAGGVAHDFNNILLALQMQADLMETVAGLPEEAREGLDDIRADIKRAADLTRQLLLFSRRQVMVPQWLNLNELILNVGKLLNRLIRAEVEVQMDLQPTALNIHADRGMIEQVLVNLAVNACDAMPTGGVLRIATREVTLEEDQLMEQAEERPGCYICLSVSDTGTGIPPEILPRIFEPFFTTKAAGKGTGLGLPTVFGIVKQHQGWITVGNLAGGGACFHIYLPAHQTLAEAIAAQPPKAKPPGGQQETILLVEDEVTVRKSLRQLLEQNGYRVLEAWNGVEARQLWQLTGGQAALLLTDLVMPGGLSGQELARQLRGLKPNLKVIFVSGYSAEIAGKEFKMQAGEVFIQKPFESPVLLEKVRQCLDA